ncbi:MAG: aspartate-semialdehyde dehydrogenase [Pseudomonadota bacterium]
MTKTDRDFRRQLDGYSLVTAEIVYRMPDALSLLQTYVWQDYDLAPEFPNLHKFLDFWQRELDGPLHSVRFASDQLLGPREMRYGMAEFAIH